MSWMRELGNTGLQVSALGLGTVKLGRKQQVKYPTGFELPDERSAAALLDLARDLGINLVDTAPAYGSSEQRLGKLLVGQRHHWLVCSKVGETFDGRQSHFDFSPEQVRRSVQDSLQRLGTEFIDIALVHSDGNDLRIIQELGTLQALSDLKREGLIRAFGMSTKTVEGGLAATEACDVLMVSYNPGEQEGAAVLDACARLKRGALIKKPLASGHLVKDCPDPVQACMDLVFTHPASSAAIVGTIDPVHLRADVEATLRALARPVSC